MIANAGKRTVAIVPAAGIGARMGQDKALLQLGGMTAIERIVATCHAAGIDEVIVVRRGDAAPIPDDLDALVVTTGSKGEMADSLRLAFLQLPRDAELVMLDPAQTLQAVENAQPISIIYEYMQLAPVALVVTGTARLPPPWMLSVVAVGEARATSISTPSR